MNKNGSGLALICIAALTLSACGGGGDPPRDATVLPDPSVTLVATTLHVAENGSVEIRADLSRKIGSDVIVPFTLSGTATSADYTMSANQIVISGGEASAVVVLTAIDNAVDAPSKSVILTMGVPVRATAGANKTTTIIIDDDESPPGSIIGRTTNVVTGAGIAGVAVSGGGVAVASSATGAYLQTPIATHLSVINSYTIAGFAPQSRTTPAFSNDFVPVLANIPMVATALTSSFNPASATTVAVPATTAQVQYSAGSLRTAGGATPTGNVTANVTPISPVSNLGVLPGNYLAASGTSSVPFETFGALDVRLTDTASNIIDLATGSTAIVNIPVATRASGPLPATTTLYYFDSTAGIYRADGTATLTGAAPNQSYQGTATHASTTYTAGQPYSTVTVTGCVEGASGTRIQDAVITAEGTSYTGLTYAITDSTGTFTVLMKTNSVGFLQASQGASISNSPQVTTATSSITLTPCLVLTPNTVSVKLTWGSGPSDLDSHTLGANSSDHIFYASKGSLTQLPYVGLDVDDVTSFGPEVTTFAKLAQNKTYRFYVHNFSNTYNPGQTGSPARVEVTDGGIQTVFTPPAGETNSTPYWHVFDMTTDSNCVPTIVPVQQFLAAAPANANVGNSATFCP